MLGTPQIPPDMFAITTYLPLLSHHHSLYLDCRCGMLVHRKDQDQHLQASSSYHQIIIVIDNSNIINLIPHSDYWISTFQVHSMTNGGE